MLPNLIEEELISPLRFLPIQPKGNGLESRNWQSGTTGPFESNSDKAIRLILPNKCLLEPDDNVGSLNYLYWHLQPSEFSPLIEYSEFKCSCASKTRLRARKRILHAHTHTHTH